MKLPKSFNEITIAQFQECYFLLGKNPDIDSWVRVISVLGKIETKYIESLPISKLKKLIQQLQFLLNPEKLNTKIKKYIVVNGWGYKAIWKAQDLNTPQTLDLKTFLRPTNGMSHEEVVVENAHKLLACIYLPLVWGGFKYQGHKHEKISNDFLSAKVGDVYGTLFFYSRTWESWIKHLVDSGNEAVPILENHMKEVEAWMKKGNLTSVGAGR